MIKSFKTKSLLLITGSTIFLNACKDTPDAKPSPDVTGSVYVINEGNFGSGNGSISIYNPQTKSVSSDPFFAKNGFPAGDVVQSLTLIDSIMYIVVNNSNKIEIADANTFITKGSIKDLALPRNFIKVNSNKAYVSEWVDAFGGQNGRISIINLTTNTITGSIEVGKYPGPMIILNNKLFLVNNLSNTISVIDPTTDAVVGTINTRTQPNSIVIDKNNKIWVACGGKKYDESYSLLPEDQMEAGCLQRIDPVNNTVEQTFDFGNKTDDIGKMTLNGSKDKLYFLSSYIGSGKVYSFDINNAAYSSSPVINRDFYGLGVDPLENKIYTGTYGFSSSQKMIIYNTTGVALDSAIVGVGPNGFVFK